MEDGAYEFYDTDITGSYSAIVVLKDDTIVTIPASSRISYAVAEAAQRTEDGDSMTDLYAIRWKPVKR